MATHEATTSEEARIGALVEIAIIADSADKLCFHQSLPIEGDHAQAVIDHLRDVICRVGWMAERAATLQEDAADMPRGGRPEAWFMSPALASRLSESMEVEHG